MKALKCSTKKDKHVHETNGRFTIKVWCCLLHTIFTTNWPISVRSLRASAPLSGYFDDEQSTLWLSCRTLATEGVRLRYFVSALGFHDCRRRCYGPGTGTIRWGNCVGVEYRADVWEQMHSSLSLLSAGVPSREEVYMWLSSSLQQDHQPNSHLISKTTTFTVLNTSSHQHHSTHTMAAIEQTWSLEGKVAVVTGSGRQQMIDNIAQLPKYSQYTGRGIGKAMAIELAKRGAKVAVNYANAVEGAEAVVKEIKALGNGSDAAAFKANVGNVEETAKLMDDVVAHFGKLDICCSNSGVVSFGHFADVEPEEFDRVFNINTRGQFFVAKEAYKRMEVGGRIILMGSITGQAKGVPKHAIYSGSKGAIETFTRCMAIGMSNRSSRDWQIC
jgi:NAD(P)-dependent dehydrogenase (short-subunit alcohol dehydrogenase family)